MIVKFKNVAVVHIETYMTLYDKCNLPKLGLQVKILFCMLMLLCSHFSLTCRTKLEYSDVSSSIHLKIVSSSPMCGMRFFV